ncbi:MAG: response regulator [Blastocatellia bacterium]|nr:response regulator [Blastocatellia bacterium]
MERKRILVVDDDDAMRTGLASLLASDTVVIRTASSREEAEALYSAETFDLVITDLRLKGGRDREGLDLIREIKQQSPMTRVVLLTGYGSAEIEREARQRGADDYWEKAILIPELLARLHALGISLKPQVDQDSCKS